MHGHLDCTLISTRQNDEHCVIASVKVFVAFEYILPVLNAFDLIGSMSRYALGLHRSRRNVECKMVCSFTPNFTSSVYCSLPQDDKPKTSLHFEIRNSVEMPPSGAQKNLNARA